MQNEQDLEMLVHAHTAALLRYCTGLLGCEADAQDAVQKTFIKRGSSATRCAMTAPTTSARGSTASPTAPRWTCCGQSNARRLPHPGAVGAGPRHQRRTAHGAEHAGPGWIGLILERVLDGLDYAALARIHGRPAAYLRTRYHRAKKQLAQRLKEGEHYEV